MVAFSSAVRQTVGFGPLSINLNGWVVLSSIYCTNKHEQTNRIVGGGQDMIVGSGSDFRFGFLTFFLEGFLFDLNY